MIRPINEYYYLKFKYIFISNIFNKYTKLKQLKIVTQNRFVFIYVLDVYDLHNMLSDLKQDNIYIQIPVAFGI